MLSFPTGVSSRTLTVDVTGDRNDELDELLVVNLSNPTGGHIQDGQGEGTITDDDSSPVASSQSPSTDEDTALPLTLGATDADGDSLTYSLLTEPEHGTLAGASASRTYTPAADFNGTDSFTFEATDGVNDSNIATVTITVNAVNDPPVATANSAILAEDSFALAPLPATDVDGDPLSYAIADGPAHGSLSGSGGSRTYTPDANYNGPDSFTFVANDGTADSNVATVSLTVVPVNDAPVAASDAATVAEDGATALDVLANDSDVDGDTLTVTRWARLRTGRRSSRGTAPSCTRPRRTTTAATASRTRSPTGTAARTPLRPRSPSPRSTTRRSRRTARPRWRRTLPRTSRSTRRTSTATRSPTRS